jgi:hypothetical protein
MNSTVNADNLDLQPLTVGCFIIGQVDIVNGNEAREVPDFRATRGELLELVKYWESTFLEITYEQFANQMSGSTEARLGRYSQRRVARITQLLGNDAVDVVRQVRSEFAERIGSRGWKEFCRHLGE